MINKSVVKKVEFISNNWVNGRMNDGQELNEFIDGRNEWVNDLSKPVVSLSEQMQEGISHRRMLLMMDISIH